MEVLWQIPFYKWERRGTEPLINLQLVNGEPRLEPNGSGGRGRVHTTDKGIVQMARRFMSSPVTVSTLQLNIYQSAAGLI